MKDVIADAGILASTLSESGVAFADARLNFLLACGTPCTPEGDNYLATTLIAREMVQRALRDATAVRRNLTPSEALRTTKEHALKTVDSGTLTVFDKVVSTLVYKRIHELVEEYPDGDGWGWVDTDVYDN